MRRLEPLGLQRLHQPGEHLVPGAPIPRDRQLQLQTRLKGALGQRAQSQDKGHSTHHGDLGITDAVAGRQRFPDQLAAQQPLQ